MLVLSRKPGEQLVIHDNVVITVLSVKGERIRLGIDAPHDVGIDRKEIYDKKKQESTPEAVMSPQNQNQ